MHLIERVLSDSSALFRRWFGFAKHWRAFRFRDLRSFCPPRRFSTRFGQARRGAKLQQNAGHDPTYLSRRDALSTVFPGMKARLTKPTGQHQLVHRRGNDHAPTLKLLRGANMYLRPQQILFEKPIAVFMGETSSIARRQLRKGKLRGSNPDKPAFAWITFGAFGSFSQDTKDGQFHLSCLSKMHVMPRLNHERLATPILPLKACIRLSPGFGMASLKEVSIFPRCASLSRQARWSRSVELAIATRAASMQASANADTLAQTVLSHTTDRQAEPPMWARQGAKPPIARWRPRLPFPDWECVVEREWHPNSSALAARASPSRTAIRRSPVCWRVADWAGRSSHDPGWSLLRGGQCSCYRCSPK